MLNASNAIHLTGNLGKDPETKTFDNGNSVTEFSLATSDTYKDREGNRQTRTEWHTVKAFGKAGETMAKYLGKGDKVQIVGTMRYRKWVDKHEQNRQSAEVVVECFNFLNNREKSDRVVEAPRRPAPSTPAMTAADKFAGTTAEPVAETSEKLPF